MDISELVSSFKDWFYSDEFPAELEKADVEELILSWSEYTETDIGDKLDDLCERIVELGIC